MLGSRCGSDRAARGSAAPGRCSPRRRRAPSASPRRPRAPRAKQRCPPARPAGTPERGHRRGPGAHRAWLLEGDAPCGTRRLGARRGTSSDPRAADGAQGFQSAPQSRGLEAPRPRGGGRPARTVAGRLERGRASRAARVKAPARAGQGHAGKSLGQTPPPPGRPRRRASSPSAPRQRLRAVPAQAQHTPTTPCKHKDSHCRAITLCAHWLHIPCETCSSCVPHSIPSTCSPGTRLSSQTSVWISRLWTSSHANIPTPRGTHVSTAFEGVPDPYSPHRDAHFTTYKQAGDKRIPLSTACLGTLCSSSGMHTASPE